MNRTEYIGKLNALYVGDKNCLEELITTYDEKGKEIERLNKDLEYSNHCEEQMRKTITNLEYKIATLEEEIKELKQRLEVEIIEDKKIEKLDQTLNRLDINDDYYRYIMENRFKINEIIDKLNEMEKE